MRAALALAVTAATLTLTIPQARATSTTPSYDALPADAATVAAVDRAPGSHLVTLVLAPRTGAAGLAAMRALAAEPLPSDAAARTTAVRSRQAVLAAAAPANGAATAVRAFGAALGLRVHAQTPTTVTLEGDPAALAKAFGTSLTTHRWQGSTGLAATTALVIPTALRGAVDAAIGLTDAPAPAPAPAAAPAAAPAKVPTPTGGAFDGTTFTKHYGGEAIAGSDGHGVTVALPALDTTSTAETASLADIAAYVKAAGLATPVPVDAALAASYPAFGAQAAAQSPITLAIESLANTAPLAQARVYRVPPTLADEMGFFATLAADAAANRVQVASTYSLFCETDLNNPTYAPFVAAVDTDIAAFDAAGGTFLASTGDGGGRCDTSHPGLGVNFPASDPGALAIGGTTASSSGAADRAWGDVSTHVGGGGGSSVLFPKPTYQAALPGGARSVPDLAADADFATGEEVYVRGAWTTLSGTTMSTPLVAGWVADAVSVGNAPGFTTSPGLGDVHTRLYAGAATAVTDVTAGSDVDYPATPGYDQATGLGVPNLVGFSAALLGPFAAPAISVAPFTRSTTVPVSVPALSDRRYRAFRLTVGPDSCAVPPTLPGSAIGPTVTIAASTVLTLVALDETGVCHVTSVPVALDTAAPVITATVVPVRAATKILVTIGVADAGSGVKSFSAIVVNRDTGRAIYKTSKAVRVELPAAGGHFEVRGAATDALGNAVMGYVSRSVATEALDDRAFGRSAGWNRTHARGRLDGTITASNVVGARLVYNHYVVGRGRPQTLTLISGGGGGEVKVFVDGRRTGLAVLRTLGSYRVGAVKPGRHNIVILVAHGYVVVDGLRVG